MNPRQFIHWLLLFLLHADAQNPFIELIHGPRCLATLVELLCVVFNHCKVLSFILYQKKKNRKSRRRKTEKPSEKDIAHTVSSSCKLNHRIQVSLGRWTLFRYICDSTWGIDQQTKIPSQHFIWAVCKKGSAGNLIVASGTLYLQGHEGSRKLHLLFRWDSNNEQCFFVWTTSY